jgi:hypothetical protein
LGIARKAVEEYVMETYGPGGEGFGFGGRRPLPDVDVGAGAELLAAYNGNGHANGNGANGNGANGNGHANGNGQNAPAAVALPVVTNARLDEAIKKLLPTHMQLIMGIGTAEELALAEVKAEEAMKRTVIKGFDAEPLSEPAMFEAKCPFTGHITLRERSGTDPVEWTHEAYERLRLVPLIARPLARNTVERFAKENGFWRITTHVMDENKQAMIEADTFDLDTMLVMFKELQAKQLQAAAEGVDGLTPEMRKFIEEAKAAGVTRCPIRDIEKTAEKCPVDFKMASPEAARAAVEQFLTPHGDD